VAKLEVFVAYFKMLHNSISHILLSITRSLRKGGGKNRSDGETRKKT
jgi:hypothetical protein